MGHCRAGGDGVVFEVALQQIIGILTIDGVAFILLAMTQGFRPRYDPAQRVYGEGKVEGGSLAGCRCRGDGGSRGFSKLSHGDATEGGGRNAQLAEADGVGLAFDEEEASRVRRSTSLV